MGAPGSWHQVWLHGVPLEGGDTGTAPNGLQSGWPAGNRAWRNSWVCSRTCCSWCPPACSSWSGTWLGAPRPLNWHWSCSWSGGGGGAPGGTGTRVRGDSLRLQGPALLWLLLGLGYHRRWPSIFTQAWETADRNFLRY